MSAPSITRQQGLAWFGQHAAALDAGTGYADDLLTELGRQGLLRIGVPEEYGGSGGSLAHAIEAIAEVAEHSLTAAFVFWGQRTFIQYLLDTPNAALRTRWLPQLLSGELAGATGLSNAMKYLSGIESLQIKATPQGEGWRLEGHLPWVTNLRRSGFIVAAAVEHADGSASIVAIPHDLPGFTRSDDLDLVALRGSNTAALNVSSVDITAEHIIHEDARNFCPRVRPSFLGLQLGMSIGLARVSLRVAEEQARGAHGAVLPSVHELRAELEKLAAELYAGLGEGRYTGDASSLFRIRIRLAEIVQDALSTELDATGGRAYLRGRGDDFVRRWHEAAFIPVVTPSLSQLRGELARHHGGTAT